MPFKSQAGLDFSVLRGKALHALSCIVPYCTMYFYHALSYIMADHVSYIMYLVYTTGDRVQTSTVKKIPQA